jgi:hypothetical protein
MHTKLNLETFTDLINGGRYKDRTAARRALGKVMEWSEKDKEAAHALVNRTFGESDDTAPKKAKRSPKVAAAKAVKVKATQTLKAPRATKTAKPASRRATSLFEDARMASVSSDEHPQSTFAIPQRAVITGRQEPASASRYNAAASIISALKNVSPLTAAEQELLELAEAEARVNTTSEAEADRLKWLGKVKTESETDPKKSAARGKTNGATAEPARPHIAVPPTAVSTSRPLPSTLEELAEIRKNLSPEENDTLARMAQMAPKPLSVGPIPPPLGG